MKCLFLAAGYATRMYPLTENFPKPLLEVKGKPILDYLIDDLNTTNEIDEYIVVTNHKFFDIFEKWSKSHKEKITILDDGSTSNEVRLGAVKDIKFVIDTLHLNEDLLILAGDNLLDFSLKGFLSFSKEVNSSCVMCYEEKRIESLKKSAVLELDKNNLVLTMEEKPADPKSNWCCPAFYFYKKEDLNRIEEALNGGCKTDAPGSLASWFVKNSKVYAYIMPGHRFDIGTIEIYNKLNQ